MCKHEWILFCFWVPWLCHPKFIGFSDFINSFVFQSAQDTDVIWIWPKSKMKLEYIMCLTFPNSKVLLTIANHKNTTHPFLSFPLTTFCNRVQIYHQSKGKKLILALFFMKYCVFFKKNSAIMIGGDMGVEISSIWNICVSKQTKIRTWTRIFWAFRNMVMAYGPIFESRWACRYVLHTWYTQNKPS